MRTSLVTLLLFLGSCLSACGQSGDLYRPDKNSSETPESRPAVTAPAAAPSAQEEEEKKKKEAAASPGAPATDSTAAPTSKPLTTTP